MNEMNIMFQSVEQILSFIDKIEPLNANFDLRTGTVMVDAKSVLGVCSLRLGSPLELKVHTNDPAILKTVSSFIHNCGVAYY